MSPDDDITALVEQLTSIHGEGGLSPAAQDWRSILALDGEGPIHLLNLLKFRPKVEGIGSSSGADAYRRYTAGVAGPFVRAGGERIFFGRATYLFGSGVVDDWDAAVVTRYPSAGALADMWLDPEFVAAHENRVDGVERSQVLVFGFGDGT